MTRAVRLVAHLALPVVATFAVASSARAQGTGETWKVRGRMTATACAGTRCATREARIKRKPPLVRDQIGDIDLIGALCDCISNDHKHPDRIANFCNCQDTSCASIGVQCMDCGCHPKTGKCGGSAIVDPAAFGAYEAAPGGARFNLTNPSALREVLRACFSNPTLEVTGFRAVVRNDPGSLAFEERVHTSFSFRVKDQPVAVTFSGRFHGTQVLTSGTHARQTGRLPVNDLVRRILAAP